MKLDTNEINHVAAAAGTAGTESPARMDMYSGIHKALRAWMASVLCRLGSTDATEAAECDATLRELDHLLEAMHGHLVTENTLVHPVILARFPGALDGIESDHAGHERAIAHLRALAAAMQAAPAGQRAPMALHLYREFALFMADNLAHMQVEETRNQELLWAACTDAQLMDLHERIIASLPPHKMMDIAHWMVPAMNHPERVMMLGGMQDSAPAEFFGAVLELTRSRLDATDWTRLCAALGLPDAGALQAAGLQQG